MRRTLWIAGILCLLLVGYILWPVAGLYQLHSAIVAKDSAALGKVVDFPALRKSLTKQLVHAYLDITGKRREKKKQPKLTLIEKTVAVGIGTSVAEPIVVQLINEKSLLELLTKGTFTLKGNGGGGGGGEDRVAELTQLAPFGKGATSIWEIWTHTEYRGDDVFTYLPPNKPRNEQFRVKLTLTGLQWKLAGLELPEPILMKFVKQLIDRQKAKEKKSG